MAIYGAKLRILFPLLLVGACAEPVRITDPKLIEIERFVNACAANEMGSVVAMAQKGVDINARNFDFQRTCLHYAAYKGNLQMVEFLLRNGASSEIMDKQGQTPLFDSIFVPRNNKPPTWDSKVVNLLLAKGTSKTVNTPNNNGVTPLYWACRLHEPGIVKLLLDYGADPNYHDNGKFWAYRCVERRLESAQNTERKKANEIWELMKAKGAKSPSSVLKNS